MEQYNTHLSKLFRQFGDSERAEAMKAYMRNKFEFYGIPSPLRKVITGEFLAEHGYPDESKMHAVVRELWKEPQRELHYFAQELLFKKRKLLTQDAFTLIEYMVTHKSWWDTVDFIASKLCGYLLGTFPLERNRVLPEWIRSKNLWLNRTAILFQLSYKKDTDTQLLGSAILPHISSSEFFQQKAIGWALREYSKTNPAWVRTFTEQYSLKPLSLREATRLINAR